MAQISPRRRLPLQVNPSTYQVHSPRPRSVLSQVIEEENEEDFGVRQPRPSVLDSFQEQAFPEWDTISAITEKAEERDLDGDWICEDMPPNAYDRDTDEVHNLHTRWSVISLCSREPLVEIPAVSLV